MTKSVQRVLMTDRQTSVRSLHYLRAIAMILVTYDHVYPGVYVERGLDIPITFVERYILWPLSIVQHFGFFGVVIFFLISGYVLLLSEVQRPVSGYAFAVKRFFRLLPPILLSLVVYHLLRAGVKLVCESNIPMYFEGNGALWTVKVEVLLYALFVCCLPLIKRRVLLGVLAMLGANWLICQIGLLIPALFTLGQTLSYGFYIILGGLVFCIHTGGQLPGWPDQRGRPLLLVLMAVLLWYCIVRYNIMAYNPETYNTGNSFGVSAMYAILFFLVFLAAEKRLPYSQFINTASRYSYGIYLNQLPFRALLLLVAAELPGGVIAILIVAASIVVTALYENKLAAPCKKMQEIMLSWRLMK